MALLIRWLLVRVLSRLGWASAFVCCHGAASSHSQCCTHAEHGSSGEWHPVPLVLGGSQLLHVRASKRLCSLKLLAAGPVEAICCCCLNRATATVRTDQQHAITQHGGAGQPTPHQEAVAQRCPGQAARPAAAGTSEGAVHLRRAAPLPRHQQWQVQSGPELLLHNASSVSQLPAATPPGMPSCSSACCN